MDNTTPKFERVHAPNPIYRILEWNWNEYKTERMVTIGQVFIGTMIAFGLIAAYVFVAWLEG